MFQSTREFHNAKHAWRSKVSALPPQLPPKLTGFKGEIQKGSLDFLQDLDESFMGKTGVLFSYSTCLYDNYDLGDNHQIGHLRLLMPHQGSLVVAFDDIQGMISGGYALTKSLSMQIFPQIDLHQDFTYMSTVSQKQTNDRLESTTRVELSQNGQVVAISSAVFVRSQAIIKTITNGINLDKSKMWDKAASWRLAGEHANDPQMSFMLHVPAPNVDQVPEWWRDGRTVDIVCNPFAGKIELYHVEFTAAGGVRAVVMPLLTSEGAPGLFHGGGAGAICIELLRNKLPELKVSTFAVRFKRPIPLNVGFVVEWTPGVVSGEWNAQFLDWQRNVLQEVTLAEQQQGKL